MIIHISVTVHTGLTTVANIYIGPVKKLMKVVMRTKMLI